METFSESNKPKSNMLHIALPFDNNYANIISNKKQYSLSIRF